MTRQDFEFHQGLLTRLERVRVIAVFLSEAKAKTPQCEADGVRVERAAEILLYELIQESLQLVQRWGATRKEPGAAKVEAADERSPTAERSPHRKQFTSRVRDALPEE